MLDVDDYVRQLGHFFLVSAGQLYITLLIGQIPLTRCCETPFPGEAFPVTRKGRIMETQDRNPEKRRRFFKRAAIATLIGGIAAGIGIKAFAQGGGCGWHRGGFAAGPLDPAQVDEHLDRMPKHLYVENAATAEPKQKLPPIVEPAAKRLLPLRESVREGR